MKVRINSYQKAGASEEAPRPAVKTPGGVETIIMALPQLRLPGVANSLTGLAELKDISVVARIGNSADPFPGRTHAKGETSLRRKSADPEGRRGCAADKRVPGVSQACDTIPRRGGSAAHSAGAAGKR